MKRSDYSETSENQLDQQPNAPGAYGKLPNRLLTAFEVAEFVGCHEETVRRAYLRGLLTSQQFGVRGRRSHPTDVLDWIRCDPNGRLAAILTRRAELGPVRIEYDIDGRDHTLDVEVMTPHYRGAHGAAKLGSGFRLYFTAHAGRGRSGGRTPSVLEELL